MSLFLSTFVTQFLLLHVPTDEENSLDEAHHIYGLHLRTQASISGSGSVNINFRLQVLLRTRFLLNLIDCFFLSQFLSSL